MIQVSIIIIPLLLQATQSIPQQLYDDASLITKTIYQLNIKSIFTSQLYN